MIDRDLELLSAAEIFSKMTGEELKEIRSKMLVKEFKKNETILYEEDTNKYMYVILTGSVRVIKTTEDGKEIMIAVHKSGDSFGEISLIDGKTTTASVLATQVSRLAIMAKEDFYSLIYSQKMVLNNLLRKLCSLIREDVDQIELLNFNNASQRVKVLLMKLAHKHGEKIPEGIILHIRLTHQDMANMAGLTRETVTRIIDKLKLNKELFFRKNRSIVLGPLFFEEEFDNSEF
jgi:CRP/FNR family cyclic AMP-dependent transcriptional regulator